MSPKTLRKWKRSVSKRYDRVVRKLGMPNFAVLNHDFESSIERWRRDGLELKLRYEYDLCADDLVIDLGGFQGDWSAEIFARYGSRIHVCEPVIDYYRPILNRFADNPRICTHPFGLSNSTRKSRFAIEGDASSAWKVGSKVVEVEFRDVVEFLRDIHSPQVALCKINIEGAEFELLERLLDAQMIHLFRDLQIQFHTFVPNAAERMENIQRRLQQTHELTYQYRFVWENWRWKAEGQAA